jgi:CubicO group peptidase (beta-lactamase class C family)
MSETPKRRGRWLRVLGIVVAVVLTLGAAGGWLFYKAYEPVLFPLRGWAALPAGPYPAASVSAPEWTEVGERARAWLEAGRAEIEAPALSAAVSVDGAVVWTGVAGYADVESLDPATTETAFRLGSSSKAVTSIAMGTLLAADRVDLDAAVSTYMPDLPEPIASVTTRQAMGHQAGVRDYGACFCMPVIEYFNRRHFETQRATLRSFERAELLFAPGTSFTYSSNGYNIAGGVIEAVTEQPFAAFLDEAVFAPLGMKGSRADTGTPVAGEARFYDTGGPGYFRETFRVDNTIKLPSGGLLSTPSDMARLGHQMIAPTLFDAATRDLLMRPQTLADGSPGPQGYALGWRYGASTPLGEIMTARLTHNGTALGSTSYFGVFPELGMVVSVMANTSENPARRSMFALAEELSAMFAAEIEARRAEASG